jgi:hypothetical protein
MTKQARGATKTASAQRLREALTTMVRQRGDSASPPALTATALCDLAGISRNALYRYHPDVVQALHAAQQKHLRRPRWRRARCTPAPRQCRLARAAHQARGTGRPLLRSLAGDAAAARTARPGVGRSAPRPQAPSGFAAALNLRRSRAPREELRPGVDFDTGASSTLPALGVVVPRLEVRNEQRPWIRPSPRARAFAALQSGRRE